MEIVQDALRRLTRHGHVEAVDIQMLARDATLPFELRRDAITIVLATGDPRTGLLRDLLHAGDDFVAIETLKIIKYLGTEWALPELVVGARTNDDPLQRSLFAWTLAAYRGNPEAEDVLLDVMASDNATIVRDHVQSNH
jgi:hypothetical protein